jgi:hypothetical protein
MAQDFSNDSAQIMIGAADLWPEAAVASHPGHWAESYVNDNPALRWIVAKYVEGGNANRNNHFWAPEDLKESVASVVDTPMNMLHKSHYIVGSFTGAKYMEEDHDYALAQEDANPYIEVVGPFWRYYFPNELATVEAAHAEGKLFVSMECIAETARWHKKDGESKDFEYRGPNDASYGEWGATGNMLQFVNPHFLGGGLIVPPVQPGWGGAIVKEIAQIIADHAEQAEDLYEAIASSAPHLQPSDWEEIMLMVMRTHKSSELL